MIMPEAHRQFFSSKGKMIAWTAPETSTVAIKVMDEETEDFLKANGYEKHRVSQNYTVYSIEATSRTKSGRVPIQGRNTDPSGQPYPFRQYDSSRVW
jgi:hypothetical protein